MKLPNHLYKYRVFNTRNLTSLKNNQIWFARPIDFNDPFDCAITFIQDQLKDEDYELVYKKLLSNRGNFSDRYKKDGKLNQEFKEKVRNAYIGAFEDRKRINLYDKGVLCLSEKKDDILMWSLYSDGHKGFCLAFDTQFEPFSEAYQVKYSGLIPKVNPVDSIFNEPKQLLIDMMTTKYSEWEHEREWRIFYQQANTLYTYPEDSLNAIYFGSSMDQSHKEILFSVLKDRNVEFYEVNRNETEFEVTFNTYEYQRGV